MTRFRPCIDLHDGKVKQIVGSSLGADAGGLRVNFESARPSAWYAEKYREDGLAGGHVIMLGPGNEAAAEEALQTWPGGLQIGGGITAENAAYWLDKGASHVIVTSYLFSEEGIFNRDRLRRLSSTVGPERVVIDLSCRRFESGWNVAMNRWRTWTNLEIAPEILDTLSGHCAEFLIHAADVEGLCNGIDEDLVKLLGSWGGRPVTYAGGARSMDDFEKVESFSNGQVDLTVGSALDLFGGNLIRYEDCVAWNRRAG